METLSRSDYRLIRARLDQPGLEERLFLAEGLVLVEEALNAGFKLHYLLIAAENIAKVRGQLAELTLSERVIRLVPAHWIAGLSSLVSPPPLVGVFEYHLPKPHPIKDQSLVLALDDISDPGNMGTILRTAEWFGITTVLVTEKGVNPFNPKVVRAAMGSLFRLTIQQTSDLKRDLLVLKEQGFAVVVTEVESGKPVLPLHKPVCIVLGNEARGVSEEIKAIADVRYTIPGFGKAESLNVAVSAGIILHTFKTVQDG